MRLSILLLLGLLGVVGCGSDVSVCLDFDDGPPSCELCDNGKDDDGDGLVDCRDVDCRDSGHCAKAAPASTSTSTTMPGVRRRGAGSRSGT